MQRRQERDLQFVLPLLASLTDAQFELFMLFQTAAVRHDPTALPPLVDGDVADAASAAAATLETAGRGIIYEHQAVSVPARRLVEDFTLVIRDLQQHQRGGLRAVENNIIAALRCLERAARTAAAALEGDDPPVYLHLARRMVEQMALNADAQPKPADPPRLILP